MYWYIVILALLLLPLPLSYIGHKYEANLDRLLFYYSSLVLLFFMACRSVYVGADTKQYVAAFEQISRVPLAQIFNVSIYSHSGGYRFNFEYGYILLNSIIGIFSKNSQAITIVVSCLIIGLLVYLVKENSHLPLLSVWLYLTLGIYQTQMNMSRNALAIFICYAAFIFIERKQPIKYVLFTLFAMTIHLSSILFLPMYWLVNKIKLTKKRVYIFFFIAIFSGILFSLNRFYFFGFIPFNFVRYFFGETTKFEAFLLVLWHVVIFGIVILFTEKLWITRITKFLPIGIWMLLMEIFFACVGYGIPYAFRMAALFGPYIIFLIPEMLYSGIPDPHKRQLSTLIIFLLCGIQYVVRLNINNIGLTMPYSFF